MCCLVRCQYPVFLECILPDLRIMCFRKYVAWYNFGNLYVLNVYCLGWFQDPLSLKSVLPGMITGSFVVRKYKLESMTLYLSWECLRMCFHTWHFSKCGSPAQMTTTAGTALKFCARSRSECSDVFVSSTWHLGEFLEIWNLGLNVNPKNLGCEVQNLETKSVLGPCANFAKYQMFISLGEWQILA